MSFVIVAASGGLAQGGEHKCSCGCERLKVRQDFLRAYTPLDAKPLVTGWAFYFFFFVGSVVAEL
ncbi:MAG: hypothetical protein LBH82_02470 [Bacteroidales bacterium]|nr:hypothetical protein [Bacteroidales bacterium]